MKVQNVKYETDILEVGMKFKMTRPEGEEFILEIVEIQTEDKFVDVYVKQDGTLNSQLWRRYPRNKCAIEFELILLPPKGQKIININSSELMG